MKKIWILFSFVIISLFNIGCGGSSSKDRASLNINSINDNTKLNVNSINDSINNDESNANSISDSIDGNKSTILKQKKIYAQGEFGNIDLNSSYKIPKEAIFLDVRNSWERDGWKEDQNSWINPNLAQGSIGGAIYEYRDEKDSANRHKRVEFVDEVLDIVNGDKKQHIILICNTSSRTKKAAKLLADNNFTFVDHIVGGMKAWKNEKLSIASFDTIDIDGSYVVPNDAIFLDIRNDWERKNENYAKGSIFGAVYEYRDEKNKKDRRVRAEFASEVLNLCENNRTKPIILICNTDARTTKASKILVENGFTNISHIKGGLSNWKSSGLPIGE